MKKLEMPKCENGRRTENGWEGDLVFNAEARYFQGHFPGLPVLPGVVQLSVAVEFLAQLTGAPVVVKSVKKMKFMHVVVPGEPVHLTLTRKGEAATAYEYRKGEVLCSSGVICC